MSVIIRSRPALGECRRSAPAPRRARTDRQPPPDRGPDPALDAAGLRAAPDLHGDAGRLHLAVPYVYLGQRPYEAINAIAHGAVDGFNFNCGLAKFRKLDAIAHAANLPCWHGSEVDLGILEAMYVHSAAAAKSCTWPSDIFGRMIRSDDLLETPLAIEPPYVKVPQGPGLGVTPSLEAIGRHKKGERVFAL